MIDLSQFVDKQVRVTFRNGNFDIGIVSTTTINPMFPYVYTGRSLKEYYNRDGMKSYKEHLYHAWDIIHIEEIKPMIDLSKFVDKRVRVTYRNGNLAEGKISETDSVNKPYLLFGDVCNTTYTKNGRYYYSLPKDAVCDIIQIEEIKPMNKYEELEKQVAEMQKEIDRLKKEETKVPEINEIEVTRTVIYAPDAYLQYCEESGVTPTQEGFIDYAVDDFDHDFADEYYGHQEIKVIGEN